MNLDFTPEQEQLRAEVRRYIEAELPPPVQQKVRRGEFLDKQEVVRWQRGLHQRGWAAPHWPPEHGGLGLKPVDKLIIQEELYRACAPMPLVFNVDMLGPVVLRFGTDAQKKDLLPRLANADLWFCQGFSEPDAGSDLASLRTRATREGDHYVVNGQKIWTTHAHLADWIFALVRTDPDVKPQRGISFLLIDLKSPGVVVRPIDTIDGQHHLNEVFFDNVKVPVSQRLGEEGQGWDCAKYLLTNERTGIARVGYCRERLQHARDLLERRRADGLQEAEAQDFLIEIARLEAELRGLELMNWRFMYSQDAARGVPAHASLIKLKGVDLQQNIAALLMHISGRHSLRRTAPQDWESIDGLQTATSRYLYARSVSIYGGATEVQKNIIAKTLLD
ncbi:acyl-CoA dehydrogenase family protein [Hydrogenophaga palleronii]|uniref:acyl-CoA dehydrogenase family protein n=1 Tax=Hydrogenophaga palleronii TaxID=65655 RepID=UPI0008261EB8|nr:acyl-CoA dehydrogenase family protein [Hydrogenophaga palleronii]